MARTIGFGGDWSKIDIIFLTLCLLLSLLLKGRKEIISHSIARGTIQLNLIIVWERKTFPVTPSSYVN